MGLLEITGHRPDDLPFVDQRQNANGPVVKSLGQPLEEGEICRLFYVWDHERQSLGSREKAWQLLQVFHDNLRVFGGQVVDPSTVRRALVSDQKNGRSVGTCELENPLSHCRDHLFFV